MAHHDWLKLDMPAPLDEKDTSDPDMPALLDEAFEAKEDSWPEAQSAVYHSYPQVLVDNLVHPLMSGPKMHVPLFDWETFVPFYIKLEEAAQASPDDFVPFDVEMEKLINELAPNEQVRDKLRTELLFPH